jgi:hypothetical protein
MKTIKIMFKLIKWTIRTMLVITGILPFAGCSSGYREKDGKVTFDGKEITDKSFVVLNEQFAKSDSTAYYKSRAFSYTDVATFEALDEHYAKDKNKVYYCDEYREGQNYYLTKKQTILEVKNTNPLTFKTIGSGYARDAHRPYFEGIAFKVKDIETFEIINTNFAKDKFQAYINRQPITGSDGKTFEIIDPYYAKDTSHIYFYNYALDVNKNIYALPCDKVSFKVLTYPFSKDKLAAFYEGKPINGADALTFTVIGEGYSRDKDAVYFELKKITGANAATFELLKDDDKIADSFTFAKDAHAVFLGDRKLEADRATFKVLALGYSSDDKNVFYKTARVKDADPLTFKTADHEYGDVDAEDAKNKYQAGKKIIIE